MEDYGLAVVNSSSLNIRTKPSLMSDVVGVLPEGFVFAWKNKVADGYDVWLEVNGNLYCAETVNGVTFCRIIL